MRPRDRELCERIREGLANSERPLPGVREAAYLECLIEQILESVHRVKFVARMLERPIGEIRADPSSTLFDPLKAAIVHLRQGRIDEAFWLVFLFVHFGKNGRGGWRFTREIYGRLNQGGLWDWDSTSRDPAAFQGWLHRNQAELKRDGVPGGFGNHRKYESLDAHSPAGTGAVVQTYVQWVGPERSHQALFEGVISRCGNDPKRSFGALYTSMDAVRRFGRTARFDYLTMVGKLGLANIEPDSAYIATATGPRTGAKLLFSGSTQSRVSASTLDEWVIELDSYLGVGMQVLEDALCNWQKNPRRFVPFRG